MMLWNWGEEMELVVDTIKEDDKGNELIGWKFRPCEGGSEEVEDERSFHTWRRHAQVWQVHG